MVILFGKNFGLQKLVVHAVNKKITKRFDGIGKLVKRQVRCQPDGDACPHLAQPEKINEKPKKEK